MAGQEWEEFYLALSMELKKHYPELYKNLLNDADEA